MTLAPTARVLGTLACLVAMLAGCLGSSQQGDAASAPAPAHLLPSGDEVIQDPGTGSTRSIPPSDPQDRPVDATLSAQGRWLEPFEGEVAAVSMVVLPDRRILYWNGVEEGNASWQHWPAGNYPVVSARSRILDLSQGAPAFKEPTYQFDIANEDLFCSGFAVLPDGRVLSAGGSYWYREGDPMTKGGPTGLDTARVFDPATDAWTNVDRLTLGRWYPTLFTMPDGSTAAASGIGHLLDPQTHWDSFEAYSDDEWHVLQGTQGHRLPLYPHVHLLPGGSLAGNVLYSAAGTLWGPFGEHPDQATWGALQTYDPATDTWAQHGMSKYGVRNYAATVLLAATSDNGHAPAILSTGGTLQQSGLATSLTEIIDTSTDPPTSKEGPAMLRPRWNHQAVLLPDGNVLQIGGGLTDTTLTWGDPSVPVMEPELFDAETQTWTLQASMSVPRMYHSTAVLLPDGRVLVGGHAPLPAPTELERTVLRPPLQETRLEIFEPGYLFRGPRPVIESAPTYLAYGEVFFVETSAEVESVFLMRTPATTHAWDANQRATVLDVVERVAGGVLVRAPASGVISQPGPHMLFINAPHPDGPIPSVAAMVNLGVEEPNPAGTIVLA